MPVGRNDVCPCGSGRKYKKCHAEKEARAFPKGLILLLVAIAAVAAIGLVPLLSSEQTQREQAGARGPVAKPGTAPPPGPPPAGKVWSFDHGHWHDAPVQASIPVNLDPNTAGQSLAQLQQQAIQQQQQFKPGPQPPGPVPEGKVWSTEHGHWHDAPKP